MKRRTLSLPGNAKKEKIDKVPITIDYIESLFSEYDVVARGSKKSLDIEKKLASIVVYQVHCLHSDSRLNRKMGTFLSESDAVEYAQRIVGETLVCKKNLNAKFDSFEVLFLRNQQQPNEPGGWRVIVYHGDEIVQEEMRVNDASHLEITEFLKQQKETLKFVYFVDQEPTVRFTYKMTAFDDFKKSFAGWFSNAK